MPETSKPSGQATGPAQDGRTAMLAPDLAALAQNGAAVSIAGCTADGAPIVGLGVGCRLAADGTLRIFLSRTANPGLIAAIADGGAVAVTFTGTRDHTSFQLKAASARLSGSCPDDLPEIERQATLLREGLVEIGFSPDQAAGYTAFDPETIVSFVIRPERVYSQTPGPGAGSELPA